MSHSISIRSFAIAALCIGWTAGCATEPDDEAVAQDEAPLCAADGCGGEGDRGLVMLTGNLPGANGSTAPGVFVYSGTATTVVKWPAVWTVNRSLPAGMPCSPYPLAAGQITSKSIIAYGSYRKCT